MSGSSPRKDERQLTTRNITLPYTTLPEEMRPKHTQNRAPHQTRRGALITLLRRIRTNVPLHSKRMRRAYESSSRPDSSIAAISASAASASAPLAKM